MNRQTTEIEHTIIAILEPCKLREKRSKCRQKIDLLYLQAAAPACLSLSLLASVMMIVDI